MLFLSTMAVVAGMFAFLLIFYELVKKYGKENVKRLGYQEFSDDLYQLSMEHFTNDSVFRIIGTTKKGRLFVAVKCYPESELVSEPFILSDIADYIPRGKIFSGGVYHLSVFKKIDGTTIKIIGTTPKEFLPEMCVSVK